MNKTATRLIAALLTSAALILTLLSVSGCGTAEETPFYTYQPLPFVSDEDMNAWRGPLVEVLSAVGADSDGAALFDLDLDGTPEVLLYSRGGSLGNVWYDVYDLYTGSLLRPVGDRQWMDDGGFGMNAYGDWTVCVNPENGRPQILHQYKHRSGYRELYVSAEILTYTFADGAVSCTHEPLFHETLTYALKDDADNTYSSETILYNHVTYSARGQETDRGVYLAARETFEQTWQRVNHTSMRVIPWETSDGERLDASDMAERLLASGQKFICGMP